jgi:hypothetical protein
MDRWNMDGWRMVMDGGWMNRWMVDGDGCMVDGWMDG